MNRTYETTADAVNYNDSAKYQMAEKVAAQMKSALGADRSQTELESLLSTVRSHAIEIRSHIAHMYTRIAPQPENDCAEKQAFNGGYVGQAEEVRSIQSETIRLLIELSKYA